MLSLIHHQACTQAVVLRLTLSLANAVIKRSFILILGLQARAQFRFITTLSTNAGSSPN